jgi:transposase
VIGGKRGSKGYNAGKKTRGRKRHILTDTDGRLLTVKVPRAKHKAHMVVGVFKRSPAKGFEVLRRRWVVEVVFTQ